MRIVYFSDICIDLVIESMRLNPNKRNYYQQGIRAMRLVESVF